MKLRNKEFCPIHRSFSCCGRELVQKGSRVRRLGMQRIEDPYQMAHYRFCSTILRLSNFRITAFGAEFAISPGVVLLVGQATTAVRGESGS